MDQFANAYTYLKRKEAVIYSTPTMHQCHVATEQQLVSSANNNNGLLTQDGKYTVNSSGTRTEPWGTPLVTSDN